MFPFSLKTVSMVKPTSVYNSLVYCVYNRCNHRGDKEEKRISLLSQQISFTSAWIPFD